MKFVFKSLRELDAEEGTVTLVDGYCQSRLLLTISYTRTS